MARAKFYAQGIVQGVGFRPFLHLAAMRLGLAGWVKNGRGGVNIEVAGEPVAIDEFCRLIVEELPPPGLVTRLSRTESEEQEPLEGFRILSSEEGARASPILPPDLATCAECMAETLAPTGRRSGYPFTCCARCGPRYSITLDLPYDRARTSMRGFVLCEECRREYEDPQDRRFHAEPISCPKCGPTLSLVLPSGENLATGADALVRAAESLRAGQILALRGLGGFQLLVLATNGTFVEELRRRKQRDEKPFAVLVSTLEMAAEHVFLSALEIAAMKSPEAPIVIARRREESRIAAEVAPNNPWLGALLPTTPLHRMLVDSVGSPLVCTSGNLSGEPLCIETNEALAKLTGIADLFLTHDRPIVRPVDDGVCREGHRGMVSLRSARGRAPAPVAWIDDRRPILGLGAFLKSTLTLAIDGALVLSQHLGDMDDPASIDLLERAARDMVRFFEARPEIIVCDKHPDFPSTRLAERLAREWSAKLGRVQHHHAHIASVMAEHGLSGEVLGLAWDGYGFGEDGQAWGGEALVVSESGARRFAHLQPFRLPGGDAAAREPRRSALGLLDATLGDALMGEGKRMFEEPALRALLGAMRRDFAAPWTTSVGRLFDAVAALAGARLTCSFEAQAAMELEWSALTNYLPVKPYSMPLSPASAGLPAVADLGPLVRALLEDRDGGKKLAEIAARFHSGLADLALAIAERAGLPRVALSGGCFQNEALARLVTERLARAGFSVFLHSRVPPNDGGISVGQVFVASRLSIGQMEG